MIKKSYYYSKNLYAQIGRSLTFTTKILIVILLAIVFYVSAVTGIVWDSVLCLLLAVISEAVRSSFKEPQMQILPVSKRFAIKQMLIVFPASFLLLINLVFLGVIALGLLLQNSLRADWGFWLIIYNGSDSVQLAELVHVGVDVLMVFMTWPLVMTSGFYRDKTRRWIALFMAFLPFVIMKIFLRLQLVACGRSYLLHILPEGLWIVITIIVITLFGWIYAFYATNTFYNEEVEAKN